MRASKRDIVLDAIVALIERDGVTSITFDAVAAETGMTRGGLLYHFPSREELILATHRHLTGQWEASLVRAAGVPADAATAQQRDAAYVRTCTETAKRVELLLMLESARDPELGALWQGVLARWAPPPPPPGDGDAAQLRRFIARLAADGLWIHETLSNQHLPQEVKERVCEELFRMLGSEAPGLPPPAAPSVSRGRKGL